MHGNGGSLGNHCGSFLLACPSLFDNFDLAWSHLSCFFLCLINSTVPFQEENFSHKTNFSQSPQCYERVEIVCLQGGLISLSMLLPNVCLWLHGNSKGEHNCIIDRLFSFLAISVTVSQCWLVMTSTYPCIEMDASLFSLFKGKIIPSI